MEVGVCVLFKKQVVLDLDFIGKGTTYTGVWYFFSKYMFLFKLQSSDCFEKNNI